tara:strand:+ start:27650 stop:28960 length:1311 start_codon:yes stop_codon:yes gene_type:complete
LTNEIRQLFADFPQNKDTSLFMVFEGLDGAGKGLFMGKIQHFIFTYVKICSALLGTREPTYGGFGYKQRIMLATDKNPDSKKEECIKNYINDRKAHQREIKTILEPSDSNPFGIVMCDRYMFSTLAFQVAQEELIYLKENNKKMNFEQKQEIFKKLIIQHRDQDPKKDVLFPDVIFLLDVPAEVALKRSSGDSSRQGTEKFDTVTMQRLVRKNYLYLASQCDNCVVVNSHLPPEQMFQDALQFLVYYLDKKCPKYLRYLLKNIEKAFHKESYLDFIQRTKESLETKKNFNLLNPEQNLVNQVIIEVHFNSQNLYEKRDLFLKNLNDEWTRLNGKVNYNEFEKESVQRIIKTNLGLEIDENKIFIGHKVFKINKDVKYAHSYHVNIDTKDINLNKEKYKDYGWFTDIDQPRIAEFEKTTQLKIDGFLTELRKSVDNV